VVPKHRSVLCTVLSLVLIIYQYTNIIWIFRHHLAISKQYLQYFGCTDHRPDEREREPLIECHSNRQEVLICASWKYSVLEVLGTKTGLKIWIRSVLDLPERNNWLMNEAATTFEKQDYLSSFIHATLGMPRSLSLFDPTRAWRLSWETAQLMYSWFMTSEWCAARQLLFRTYLRSLVYACKYIYSYGTSKILLSLKNMPCYTVGIIIRNVAVQGLFSLDLAYFWCHLV